VVQAQEQQALLVQPEQEGMDYCQAALCLRQSFHYLDCSLSLPLKLNLSR
jgi:hypothetical protein